MVRLRISTSILCLVLIAGCGQVYSPYLMLPAEPLKQDDVQFVGGLSALPSLGEVLPGSEAGATALIRYGITDRFSLEGEMWTNSILHFSENGFAIQGVELLSNRNSEWRIGVIPRLCVVNSRYQLEGWGASAAIAVWTPKLLGLSPYAATGAGVGAADLHSSFGQYAFGYSITENAGISYELWSHMTLTGEFAFLGVLDMHNRKLYGWLLPSLSAGYRF